ncbi:MAG: TlpA family protein disulfide reductase [Alphaproteobacteria bacterium]
MKPVKNIVAFLLRPALILIVTAFLAQSSVASAAPAQPIPGFEPAYPPRALPEVQFTDGTGRALTLADFRGRVVLLNFWATWCAPCIREMPSLDRLQAALGGSRFEVVALSLDRGGAAKVAPFFERLKLRNLMPYYDEKSLAARALGINGLPTTLLIGPKGNELGRIKGPVEWDSIGAYGFISSHLDLLTAVSAQGQE